MRRLAVLALPPVLLACQSSKPVFVAMRETESAVYNATEGDVLTGDLCAGSRCWNQYREALPGNDRADK